MKYSPSLLLLLLLCWTNTSFAQKKSPGLQVYQSDATLNHNSPELKTNTSRGPTRGTNFYGADDLGKLKAVLIVGPVTSDTDSWTLGYIDDVKAAATVLRQNNVEVIEFYPPSNDWEEIKKASENANFIIYKGHGVYDGSSPPKWVGGFALKNSMPSSQDIINDMKLAPNAVILISGCFTAGNAGSDIGMIDLPEAKRRVEMYSKPFFTIKAAGYYANWYPSAFHDFLEALFEGRTMLDAYQSYGNGNNAAKIENFSYIHQPALKMYIGNEDYSGKTAYNNAFIGDGSKTLRDLFGKAKKK